jgi:hypothetical protein
VNPGLEIPEAVGREVVEERLRLRLRAGRGARGPRGEGVMVVVIVNSHQLLHFLRRSASRFPGGWGLSFGASPVAKAGARQGDTRPLE